MVDDNLDLLLLFRVQDLREVFVQLWLLLLQLCAPNMLVKGRPRGMLDTIESRMNSRRLKRLTHQRILEESIGLHLI